MNVPYLVQDLSIILHTSLRYSFDFSPKEVVTHLLSLLKLPDSFQDFVRMHTNGKKAPADLQTHCRREVMHAVWKVILDDDLQHAWHHADYPENVLYTKKDIHRLGQKSDDRVRLNHAQVDDTTRRHKVETARQFIIEKRKRVTHDSVKGLLDDQSLTPVENAFSTRLRDTGFDFHSMLVVDVLHEWEVGIWRHIFTHLIRILDSYNSDKIDELNRRYREVPSFGDSIRAYDENITEMKQMTAYAFEDLLQESLLEAPHENIVLDMLYHAATVHALAKLRMHTDATVAHLSASTKCFGAALRKFHKVTCSAYATTELSQESQKCIRKEAGKKLTIHQNKDPIRKAVKKDFSFTYKIHMLGHYSFQILSFGTTDSYSTGIGETEHHKSKMNFLRMNKVKYVKQLTNVERRQTNLDRIDDRIKEALSHVYQESQESNSDDDPPDRVSCYHMGCKGVAFHLHRWLHQHRFDPATKNFYVLLLDHLLARMMGRDPDDELLKRLQNHYTTYDLQRKYDSINPTSSNSDIMVLSQDSDPEQRRLCPFWCYVMSSENIFEYENGVPDNLESEDDLDDSEMLDGSGADGCAADSSTAGSDVDIDISEY
ncbi:hypothetical protein EW145_g8177 [Phellinidium pouzarii]|uniref:Uncharacterized protein n=1 Tax=Phellinidium pouzarii TaxID=167371 RepID=A0A4S4K8M7_9AGAM|nr:hypothetical protein EW145_g8177 [Phellinidium pouzarii]